MRRPSPFARCERRSLPGRLKAEIITRQDGRCTDCGTRLILGSIVFDHRPPLAIREPHEDANDPGRLAAICRACDERKTPRDLREIAKTKRLAERHQEFVSRRQDKVPGRRVPSAKQWRQVQEVLGAERSVHEPTPQSETAPARSRDRSLTASADLLGEPREHEQKT